MELDNLNKLHKFQSIQFMWKIFYMDVLPKTEAAEDTCVSQCLVQPVHLQLSKD